MTLAEQLVADLRAAMVAGFLSPDEGGRYATS